MGDIKDRWDVPRTEASYLPYRSVSETDQPMRSKLLSVIVDPIPIFRSSFPCSLQCIAKAGTVTSAGVLKSNKKVSICLSSGIALLGV